MTVRDPGATSVLPASSMTMYGSEAAAAAAATASRCASSASRSVILAAARQCHACAHCRHRGRVMASFQAPSTP